MPCNRWYDPSQLTREVTEVSEARITDLPYGTLNYIAPAIKSAAERTVARDLLGPMDEAYVSLWEEFEVAETLEARIVRAADKIQMMAKVLHYEREGRGDLIEFWRNVEYNENDWGIELARRLFEDIRRRHEEDMKGSTESGRHEKDFGKPFQSEKISRNCGFVCRMIVASRSGPTEIMEISVSTNSESRWR